MSESQLFRYKSRESSKKIQLAQNTKCNNLLSELDEVEIYEWGHLKLLKVNRLLKRKKIQEVIDFLKEVIIGIECKTSDLNNEFPNRMKNRILEEIKLPAMKKLRNIFVNDKKYQDAFEISKKVFFLKKKKKHKRISKILEVENTEDNRNIKISLYRVLEDKNHETNNFLKDNMVIDINSFSNLPKNEDDNEINV